MYILFLCFCFISVIVLSYMCNDHNWIISVMDLTLNGSCWNALFDFDAVSVSILLMLGVCFGYANFYTTHYFSGDTAGSELNKIICLFVGVMASLTVTGDLLTTLVFWEYLGVVSFFLILYYSSYLSLRSSIITLVSSRFGDVSLFLLIALSLYSGYFLFCAGLLIFFIVFTKSAGFPFTSWLLEAMRAPTPVSSLVHSSTLVAAGVWFSMRYDAYLFLNSSDLYLIFFTLTVVITGLCCFFFLDLKKIVALSTCNNIAWCVLYLVYGDVLLSLFQLVSHGVSKCLLFMLVGDIMSGSGGSQASNCVYSPQLYGNWGIFSLFSIILGLSGAPFIGVFFTKHFLLSIFNSAINISLFLILGFCVFLSYFYSFRFCRILVNNNTSLSMGILFSFNSGLMVYFWLALNYFITSYMEEVSLVSSTISLFLMASQLVSCLIAYWFYNSILLTSWSSSLFGCDNLVELSFSIFNDVSNMVGAFFYRWDSNLIFLFSGSGVSFISIFKSQMLNVLMLSWLFCAISWYCISC